ncbi:MAG: oligosaccharide flippase family protein, partial [Acidobacteria bacterium]|nr:oligosaccharide flippase family protein [Acidobacteriota bacterium]
LWTSSENPDLSAKNTAERFFRSAGAAAFSQFWRVGVAFGVDLILRRWIPPADYGVWSWALTAFLVLGALRDLGLIYHVVRVDPRPYGNLLVLELVWGSVLVVTTFFGAPLLARAYLETGSDLILVLKAMTLFLFFEGLAAVPKTYFEAELEVGRVVKPEIVRNLVMAVIAVAMAWRGYGIWSLVIAQVTSAAVYAAYLWLRAWGKMPLHYVPGGTLKLVGRSWPLALIWFLIILVDRIDLLVLGAQESRSIVGNYEFAYSRAFLASTILTPAITRTLYPALVAFRSRPEQLFEAYRLATVLLVCAQAPIALFLFANAEITLRILGGPQWKQAPIYLAVLCFAPLIEPIGRLGGEVLKTLHRDGLWIVCSLLTLVSFGVGGWFATQKWGPMGMAWVNFLPLGGLLMAWALHRIAPQGFRRLLRDLLLIYLIPTLVFLLIYYALADLELRFAVSLLALGLVIFVFWRRFGPQFLAFFRDPVAATEGRAT